MNKEDGDGKKKVQWREVTNEIAQVPVDQRDFRGCVFIYKGMPLFRIGWALMSSILQPGQPQALTVTSAVMKNIPPIKFVIDNSGFRCWLKEGVFFVPPTTIIKPT